jgi:hypothetical protein
MIMYITFIKFPKQSHLTKLHTQHKMNPPKDLNPGLLKKPTSTQHNKTDNQSLSQLNLSIHASQNTDLKCQKWCDAFG